MEPAPRAPVLIRAVRMEDADAITAIRNLPGVRHGTLALPFPMVELTRKWIEAIPRGDLCLVAEVGGEVVGQAGLNRYQGRRGHCAGLGIMVHDDHHGRGVGTALMAALVDAADNWLALRRLELEVNTDNLPALALYRRFGFVVEGRHIGDTFRAGAFIDSFSMARLAARGEAAGEI